MPRHTSQFALSLLLAAGVAAAAAMAWAQDAKPAGKQPADKQPANKQDEKTSLMRKKLEYSQRILSGMATEDFDEIRKNAEALQALGRSKAFAPGKTAEYRAQFLIFDFANGELVRFSKDKNLDGAALAYTQLTLSCVNCHKQVRAP